MATRMQLQEKRQTISKWTRVTYGTKNCWMMEISGWSLHSNIKNL